MLSSSGRCRIWDANNNGYGRGEGLAVVVLKTLSQALADNDHIECLIRETGVNQDGRLQGITVPSPIVQSALIRSTYENCSLNPTCAEDSCQYSEAHGTGTAVGDPKEADAIRDVFFPVAEGSVAPIDVQLGRTLYVGSVKTVLGHTEGAAGLVAVLKAALALQKSQIPPNMHFEQLNPAVEPFYHPHLCVPTDLQAWPKIPPSTPRRVSVNSFSFGGTNCHVILQSWDEDLDASGDAKVPPHWLDVGHGPDESLVEAGLDLDHACVAASYRTGYLSAQDAIRVAIYRGLHSSLARSSTGERAGSMMAVSMALDSYRVLPKPPFQGQNIRGSQ